MEFCGAEASLSAPLQPSLGRDLLLEYYGGKNGLISVVPGPKGPQALTRCSADFSSLVCQLNLKDYHLPMTLGNLLRMTPMRRVLQEHRILFLHASQIGEGGYLYGQTQLVLSVVSNQELVRVEKLVHRIDPECFMVVSRVREVRGRGFSMVKQYQ